MTIANLSSQWLQNSIKDNTVAKGKGRTKRRDAVDERQRKREGFLSKYW